MRRLVLALSFVCACAKHEPREVPESTAATLVPAEPPRDWTAVEGRMHPSGPGHIVGGFAYAAGRGTAIVAMLRLANIDLPTGLVPHLADARPTTATFGRIVGEAALHHRVHVPIAEAGPWLATLAPATHATCGALPSKSVCTRTQGLTVGLLTRTDALQIDVLDGRLGPDLARVRAQISSVAPTGVVPLESLGGHVRAWVDVGAAATALAHRGATLPPAAPPLRSITVQWDVEDGRHRGVLEWNNAQPWPTAPRTDAVLPSMAALCEGAVACGRTGPWPSPTLAPKSGPWRLPRLTGPDTIALALITWPFLVDAAAQRARASVPNAARGFVDGALSQLAGVHGGGLRMGNTMESFAFVRADAALVNFVAGVLSYAGLTPNDVSLSNGTFVSWAQLPGTHAGLLLALDEGPSPARGWLALAERPEALTWLSDAAKTDANAPGLELRMTAEASRRAGLPRLGTTDFALSVRGSTLRADIRAQSPPRTAD